MKRAATLLWLLVGGLGLRSAPAEVSSVRLVLPPHPSARMLKIEQIFTRQLSQRCPAAVVTNGDAPLRVELVLGAGLGSEAFRISEPAGGGVQIAGGDERGVLYGVGKFLRSSRFEQTGFTPGAWRGTAQPGCAVRGIYFATHYGNFYEAAPASEVQQYVEDLALWGVNSLVVHFPHWEFDGFDDPGARRMLAQLRSILQTAKASGMQVGLIEAANQAFKSTPRDLRNTPVPDPLGRHGNSGVNLCPSKPKAHAVLVRDWRRLLDQFREVGLDFIIYWPYDEGGCGCPDCWPWGARGYPKLCRELSELTRTTYPQIQFILSTWTYDTPPAGEWEGLARCLARDHSWVNYLMADAHEDFPRYPLDQGVPGGRPLLNFPEISMWGQGPWGGYGANPFPARLQRLWDQTQRRLAGGFPYSEGIFEDLNKVICSQFYWNPEGTAAETVKEYVAFEFSPEVVGPVCEAIQLFEQNHSRDRIGSSAERALQLLQVADAKLTPTARRSWRWRLVYLRGQIDQLLFQQQKHLQGNALRSAFEELDRIYHAENAAACVHPPRVEAQ